MIEEKNRNNIVDCPADLLESHKQKIAQAKLEIVSAFNSGSFANLAEKIVELDRLFQKDNESLLDKVSLEKMLESGSDAMTGVKRQEMDFVVGLCNNNLEIKFQKTGSGNVVIELVKGNRAVFD
ncbi:MAG: hypothetical protein WAV48_03850, partial [Candidatus Magasanikiibacteriota bacterium]